MAALWRILALVSASWRRRAALVVALMILGAGAEVLTLGAIVPFLAIMANGAGPQSHPGIAALVHTLPGSPSESPLLAVTILFAALACLAGSLRVLLIWFSNRFVFGLGNEISTRLFATVLRQPYSRHIAASSSEALGAVNKVQILITDVLLHAIRGLAAIIVAGAIVTALLLIDPMTAGLAMCGLGAIYGLVTCVARRHLHRNAQAIAETQALRVKTVQEGLGAIRDVTLDRLHGLFIDRYDALDRKLQQAHMLNACAAKAPRFIVEALAMVLIAVLALYLAGQPGGLSTALPVLGALALGGQRLLPLVQDIYQGWAQLRGYGSVVSDIAARLEMPAGEAEASAAEKERPALPFSREIALNGVGFRYGGDQPWVLRDADLTIPKGARVAFVGPTGGGKSTLADLIMGLLEPVAGELRVDGRPVDMASLPAWQQHIAHVPQASFLLDASIAENIALGVPVQNIDMARVRAAADKARIGAFVDRLPDRYRTRVGERGVRLSGGQRQRIAIARAFYKQASVFVFDEATSALDGHTEAGIVETIARLEPGVTVVMIAHRESSLACCDTVYRIDAGRISRIGPVTHPQDRDAPRARNGGMEREPADPAEAPWCL